MRAFEHLLIVLASTLGGGLLAAWGVIPFLTSEASYLFLVIGAIAGFIGSVIYVARARRLDSTAR
jgi:hypothetical protein